MDEYIGGHQNSRVREKLDEVYSAESSAIDPPDSFTSARRLFERRILYRQVRPMPVRENRVVSPADARILPGSLRETDQ